MLGVREVHGVEAEAVFFLLVRKRQATLMPRAN